jgi:hypothetical protein
MLDILDIEIPDDLYNELFECEVNPYSSEDIRGGHHQFSQAMINAESMSGSMWLVELSRDAFLHLVNVALPTHMEMWYSWGDEEGFKLLNQAKEFLDEHDISYPY